MRVVSRVYVVVYLFGTFAGLAWLHMVTERIRSMWLREALLAIIAAVLIWEQTGGERPSFERASFYPRVDRLAEDLRGARVGYILPRYTDPDGSVSAKAYGEVLAMWVGMRANVPVVNGYSGVLPDGYLPFAMLTDEQLRDWRRGKYHGTIRVLNPDTPGQFHDVEVE